MSARSYRCRRGYIHLTLLVLFLGLCVRLAWIQVRQHSYWADLASRMETQTLPLAPQRGFILDRNGHSLAVTVRVSSVYINPRAVPQDQHSEVAAALARILKLDASRVEAVLDKPKYFAWIKRKVTDAEADATRKADLPGVGLREETQRRYPYGSFLCHVLGFVGVDEEGLDGLEAQYNAVLAGTPGEEMVLRDGLGRRIGVADGVITPPVDGQSLVLAIDSRIQRIAEEELAEACAKHRPDAASAVVLDPWTGDVLALANWPTFEPARYSAASPDVRKNMTVMECLEPGSSFKPFVASKALECGAVTPETVFDCHEGVYRIGPRTLHDVHPYGRLSVRDIIAYSSNIGMAQVGERLGPDRMYRGLRDFGFGQKTGIELPGESAGLLNPPSRWSKLTISSIPMGQEVACSPLQLAAGFCVFANGGYYVRPRIVLGAAESSVRPKLQSIPAPAYRRALSERTARLMCGDLLAGVVGYGTAHACAIEGYAMAGKTGTGQLTRAGARGYEPGSYSAVFVGIVPVQAPRFVIAVVMKRPKGGSYYGGVVSAPAVAQMAERILSTWRIPRVASAPETHSLAVNASVRKGGGH